MKKVLSVALSAILIASMLFAMPLGAKAEPKKSVNDASITVNATGCTFDEYEATIASVDFEIKDGDTVLTKDTDYSVTYDKYNLTIDKNGDTSIHYYIDGIGNYTGEAEGDYKAKAPVTGKAGEEAKWSYDSDAKMLNISGNGKFENARKGDFNTVYIEGVSTVGGMWAFIYGEEYYDYPTANNILVTGSVKTIESDAFRIRNVKNIDIQSGVKTLKAKAITPLSKNYKYLYVPKSVTKIGKQAVGYRCVESIYEEDASYKYKKVKNFIILGESGSAAQKYAKKNKIDFVALKPSNLSKVTAGKKSFKAKWSKADNGNGYEICYSTSEHFVKANSKNVLINSASTTAKTFKKLKSGKKYYVRVRSFKKIGKKKYYSCWSKAKAVKVK